MQLTPFPLLIWVSLGLCGFPAQGKPSPIPVEGEILARSPVPDPITSTYKDCLFTAEVRVGLAHPPHGVPSRVLLAFRGFTDRTLNAESRLRVGDKFRADLVPFESMPDAYKQLRQVDHIADLNLPYFAATQVLPLVAFSGPENVAAAERDNREAGSYAHPVVPTDSGLAQARAEWIREQVRGYDALRDQHGGWAAWQRETAPYRDELRKRAEAAGSARLTRGDLTYDPAQDPDDAWMLEERERVAAMIESLVHLKQEFARLGSDLIVVPFPLRMRVAAPAFLAAPPVDGELYPLRVKLMRDLLAAGVEVIDLEPALRAFLGRKPPVFHYADEDFHPGQAGVEVAAFAIAERLRRYRFEASKARLTLRSSVYGAVEGQADSGSAGGYPCEQVIAADGEGLSLPEKSPILFIGDSFLDTPERFGCPHANIPHRLAYELGVMPSVCLRTGSGHLIQRSLARIGEPEFLFGRQVVVYLFNGALMFNPYAEWEQLPFLDAALRSADLEQRFLEAELLFRIRGPRAFGRLRIEPPLPEDAFGASKTSVPTLDGVRRIEFRSASLVPGERYLMQLRLVSQGPGRIRIVIHGQPVAEPAIYVGKNDLYVPFVGEESAAWTGIEVPALQPNHSLLDVEVRRETGP